MLQSLTLRLETTEEDKSKLLETMKKYNKACNFVAERAFNLKLANKYKLQKEVYKEIRDEFNLSAQLAIRVISKVVEVYKRDKSVKPIFRELGTIQYDQRNSKVRIDHVSIMTLEGRLKLKTRIGKYQRVRSAKVQGQCDLFYKSGIFYLIVVVDAAEESEHDVTDALGVDLGIENIAVDSDGQIFDSKQVEQKRQYYNKRRATLQKVGTKSAKRRLKKNSGKERFLRKMLIMSYQRILFQRPKAPLE
jgi:putative transposase